MPPRKGKKGSKSTRKSSRKTSGSGDSQAISYNGPIHLPGTLSSVKPIKINSTYYTACTTSAGGVVDVVFGNSPAVLNEWSTWQGLYHEYRVLGMELKYIPIKNVANWAYGFGTSVLDRENSSALGSTTAATNHESMIVHQMYNSWSRTAKMSGTDESVWLDVASPAAKFYIKLYSSGNSTIQTIGGFFLEFLLEFRVKA
jgi:hypothetical protein